MDNPPEPPPLRWGILGCGRIAKKFTTSLAALPGSPLPLCASNSPGKAAAFAEEFGLPHSYDSYEALLANPDVDAIYIASTHNFHHQAVLASLEAGKHVLCEKPMAVTVEQTRDMIEKARSRDLFLMEALWTRFLPALVELRRWLQEQRIGNLQKIYACFGFQGDPNPEGRLFNPDLAGGALYDVGIYPLSIIRMIQSRVKLDKLSSEIEWSEQGVDQQSRVTLQFSDGVKAEAFCSLIREEVNELVIEGDQGQIRIPPWFHAASGLELSQGSHSERLDFGYNGPDSFKHQIRHVHGCIAEGLLESPIMPLDESLEMARWIEQALNEARPFSS